MKMNIQRSKGLKARPISACTHTDLFQPCEKSGKYNGLVAQAFSLGTPRAFLFIRRNHYFTQPISPPSHSSPSVTAHPHPPNSSPHTHPSPTVPPNHHDR